MSIPNIPIHKRAPKSKNFFKFLCRYVMLSFGEPINNKWMESFLPKSLTSYQWIKFFLPGPFAPPTTRPSLKITALSYSCTTYKTYIKIMGGNSITGKSAKDHKPVTIIAEG